jgi:hypothetical protein
MGKPFAMILHGSECLILRYFAQNRGFLLKTRTRLSFLKRNAAIFIAAFNRPSIIGSLAMESIGVATQEAFPVALGKVAKAGVLEVMRSFRIVALSPMRVTGAGA